MDSNGINKSMYKAKVRRKGKVRHKCQTSFVDLGNRTGHRPKTDCVIHCEHHAILFKKL